MIFGSHDSCACTIKNKSYWIWAKTQDKTNINLVYVFSIFKDAITELIQCSKEENDYIFIRLKRDSSSPGLPPFGNYLMINDKPLSSYVIEYDGWSFMDKKPVDSHRII